MLLANVRQLWPGGMHGYFLAGTKSNAFACDWIPGSKILATIGGTELLEQSKQNSIP